MMYGFQKISRTKRILRLAVACLLALTACDNGGKPASHTEPMQHADQTQALQLLINQALVTAAHGVNLKLEGKAEGNRQAQALLTDASGLLRRAMSGPEMAMMHKGGQNMSASMKHTHDMGDTAFDLLGLMMALSPDDARAAQLHQANDLLAMAASASMMLLQAESAGDLKTVMQEHARKLLDQARQSFADIQGDGDYQTLVSHLLQAPDKSLSSAVE